MTLTTHTKNTWASNLIRASAVLSLAYYYLIGSTQGEAPTVIAMCVILGILMFLAMFIRAGHKWPKWVLLVLLIATIIPDVISLPSTIKYNLSAGLMAILIDVVQITALVLLFIPAKNDPEPEEDDLPVVADQ
ncbi:hypothetical protein AAFN85_11905 [Mucilaginibacter sp. CAU 1740]|uniref:hypothetical protein n=1 Tax=Mucilaginibacter sp. CAU 1740 TaxID=3140365 RepID=UPI00325B07F4